MYKAWIVIEEHNDNKFKEIAAIGINKYHVRTLKESFDAIDEMLDLDKVSDDTVRIEREIAQAKRRLGL